MRLKKESAWGTLRYLVYFSQIGFTLVTPPVICTFAAWWLKNRFGWGNGVVLVGILLGIATALCSLRNFLRFMQRKADESRRRDKP